MDRNHRMELQYDGTGLHGWAKQPGLQTVEGCLEEAFRAALGTSPLLRVAGRTDTGVHARRQVVSLLLPEGTDLYKLRRSLNALTPDGIAVFEICRASARFDARQDATSRSYRYFVCIDPIVSPFWSGYCCQEYGDGLDLAVMREAAALTVGRHHFTALTPTVTGHVFFDRTVLRCNWTRVGGAAFPAAALGGAPAASGAARGARRARGAGHAPGMLCLEIEADAFLRHMVRSLVGTMLEVGRGERSLDDFRWLLEGAPREAAGKTAPPEGLFLWDIKYGRGCGRRFGPGDPHCGTIPGGAGAQAAGRVDDETIDSEA